MSAIGPGDWVECVHARRCACGCVPGGGPLYLVGRVYQVVFVCDEARPCGGLHLSGVPCPEPHHCFPAEDFRPLYRPKADFIDTLKQPAPDVVRELEDA